MNPLFLLPLVASLAAATVPAQVSTRTVGAVTMEDVPEIPKAVADRMLQYQNTRSADLMGFSPDMDGMLIATRFGETSQLHWVKSPGAARRQLTFFKEPIRGAALRPVPGVKELVFLRDEGGSEFYQLYRFSLKDAKPVLITDGKSRNEGALWSRDGERLVFNSTARNGKDFDFWLYDAQKGERKPLLQVEGQWHALDWSPDGAKLLVMKYVSINETYLQVLDVATAKLTPLFPGQEKKKVAYGTAKWAGPGQILFTSDESGEFVRLGLLDTASGKVRWLTSDIPWNVDQLSVSKDGRKAAFVVNEDAVNKLYVGPAAGPFTKVSALPMGVISDPAFSFDGATLGFVMNTPTTPGDIFALDWATSKLERWTESETGGLPPESFVEPMLVRYPTFDADNGKPRTIPAFYYKPRGAGPFPVIVYIHGGPESQEQPDFAPTFQYWLNELGLAVLVPNVRGSDGYGKSYLLLDNGVKREDSVKDIGALLDWVAKQPELDAKRVAVYGGSYGGYMVLASLARYADRLKAGVDYVGVSNFVTFLKNTKDYRRDLRRAEYGDERDPAMEKFLQSISPTNLSDRITSRLFVVQGQNDPRVPASEAEQIVAAVRKNGQPVWYMLAGDEGHGFQKKGNRDLMGQAVSVFWERFLK